MKRHVALQDYSRDHHFLLLQAREIRWFVEGSEHAAPFDQLLARFLRAWEEEIVPHLREEEEVLLPFYGRHPDASQADLQRVLGEHEWLRAQVARLEAEGTPADLLPLLAQVGERLHDHVRFEERTLFARLQRLFSEQELEALLAQCVAYRQRHRPDAIGPRG